MAGESVARVHDARGELLVVEAALGALLLLVTFTGSFVVGLRASAPIEQVRRRQAEFTADASHELRTPLSVIEAEVDLALARPRAGDEYRDTLERVASESHRLRAIVDDLLWLARADGQESAPDSAVTVDVANVVATAGDRFRAVADAGVGDPGHPGRPVRDGTDPRRRGRHRPAGHGPRGQRLQVRRDRGAPSRSPRAPPGGGSR